ncbi:MAG: hypothetical protein IJA34_02555 [Lachnospiraceae bacterium]|nr:hypothetical protein [Lachnospiraceae bacterium]
MKRKIDEHEQFVLCIKKQKELTDLINQNLEHIEKNEMSLQREREKLRSSQENYEKGKYDVLKQLRKDKEERIENFYNERKSAVIAEAEDYKNGNYIRREYNKIEWECEGLKNLETHKNEVLWEYDILASYIPYEKIQKIVLEQDNNYSKEEIVNLINIPQKPFKLAKRIRKEIDKKESLNKVLNITKKILKPFKSFNACAVYWIIWACVIYIFSVIEEIFNIDIVLWIICAILIILTSIACKKYIPYFRALNILDERKRYYLAVMNNEQVVRQIIEKEFEGKRGFINEEIRQKIFGAETEINALNMEMDAKIREAQAISDESLLKEYTDEFLMIKQRIDNVIYSLEEENKNIGRLIENYQVKREKNQQELEECRSLALDSKIIEYDKNRRMILTYSTVSNATEEFTYDEYLETIEDEEVRNVLKGRRQRLIEESWKANKVINEMRGYIYEKIESPQDLTMSNALYIANPKDEYTIKAKIQHNKKPLVLLYDFWASQNENERAILNKLEEYINQIMFSFARTDIYDLYEFHIYEPISGAKDFERPNYKMYSYDDTKRDELANKIAQQVNYIKGDIDEVNYERYKNGDSLIAYKVCIYVVPPETDSVNTDVLGDIGRRNLMNTVNKNYGYLPIFFIQKKEWEGAKERSTYISEIKSMVGNNNVYYIDYELLTAEKYM